MVKNEGEFTSVKQSLVVRTGLALAALVLASLVGIVSSALTAESVDGDAARINLAGSLRMQSYRIATVILKGTSTLDDVIEEAENFDRRVNSPLLKSILDRNTRNEAKQVYRDVVSRWDNVINPVLQNETSPDVIRRFYLAEVEHFVASIDNMVKLLEEGSESKIKLLRVILFISMFFTVLVVFITLYNLQVHVVNPLRDLVVSARRIRAGKFDSRVSYKGDNELGLLSVSFNQMSEDLSQIYRDLELRVEEKTSELIRSNEALTLLYDSSRRLSEETNPEPVFSEILGKLQKNMAIEELALCFGERDDQRKHCVFASPLSEIPSFCGVPNCQATLDSISQGLELNANGTMLAFEIKKHDQHFGHLVIRMTGEKNLDNDQVQLLTAICDIMASALSLQQQRDQSAHLMLVEERATIARELHDSLAQSLSYQKIQLSRLRKAIDSEVGRETISKVMDDIRDGLNIAYQQLRELLSTFRLKLDQPGLEKALEATLEEFSERSEVQFDCEFQSKPIKLSSHEEIHCLQIIREGLSNIVRHSGATRARLSLSQDDEGAIDIQLDDDGVGMPEGFEKINHYGLEIMRERTHSLGGRIRFSVSELGGVKVQLHFSPGKTGAARPMKRDVMS